jgi:hypothetical protein
MMGRKMGVVFYLLFNLAHSISAQQLYIDSDGPLAVYQEINNSLIQQNPRKALKEFRNVKMKYLKKGRENELAEKYFGMALGLALNGYYQKSIRFHKKAIRMHEKYQHNTSLEMSINLGLTYHLAGKDRKAKRILGESI